MTKEYDNVLEAKRSIKDHIKFMETLLKNLKGTDKLLRGRAVWTSWCIHQYFQHKLMDDIKNAIEKNTPPSEIVTQ